MTTESRCAHGLWDNSLCDICHPEIANPAKPTGDTPTGEPQPQIPEDLQGDYIHVTERLREKYLEMDAERVLGQIQYYIERIGRAEDRIAELESRNQDLEMELQAIHDWCEAYPLEVFPAPDMKRARELLGDAEFTRLNAHSMRHVVEGFKRRAALAGMPRGKKHAPRHLGHLHSFYCMLCKEYLGSTGENGFYTGTVVCLCGARNYFDNSIDPVVAFARGESMTTPRHRDPEDK